MFACTPLLFVLVAFVASQNPWVVPAGGKLPFMPVTLSSTATASDCASYCNSYFGCIAWTFKNSSCSGSGNLCWAKYIITNATDSCSTSGQMPLIPAKYKTIVSFGDGWSDNGNGSYAHALDGGSRAQMIYGYETWTNGPVWTSYLAAVLGADLQSWAYGGANGGSEYGARINETYTTSSGYAPVPSGRTQVSSYVNSTPTATIKGGAASTLYTIWVGQHDLDWFHIHNYPPQSVSNQYPAVITQQTALMVNQLLAAGAQNILVMAIQPRQLTPAATFYCGDQPCLDSFGALIAQTNAQLSSLVKNYSMPGVMYYDAYSQIVDLYNNYQTYGFKNRTSQCDPTSWNDCVNLGHGYQYLWNTYYDATSKVHQLVAQKVYSSVLTPTLQGGTNSAPGVVVSIVVLSLGLILAVLV